MTFPGQVYRIQSVRPLHEKLDGRRTFLRDVHNGLTATPKTLPCKYLYDARGSELFDAICELDEYYPTRTELGIMRERGGEMLDAIGEGSVLIEYGSGSSLKTRLLLERARGLAGYVPIDISGDYLNEVAAGLRHDFPHVPIRPVTADYTRDFELPEPAREARRRVVYFPGSTIGNFEPKAARRFLQRIARVCGEDGGLLIGVDLRKDRAILEPAYDDARGVTAEFNLNLLRRINRELDGEFDLGRFTHRAVYNARASRVEMHLVSRGVQTVRIAGEPYRFADGETIWTESSYKYTLAGFAEMAGTAGLRRRKVWTDADRLFSVQFFSVHDAEGD